MVYTYFIMARFNEIVSEDPNNKDKKNQPKRCGRSSVKGVTRKRYFKHAEYQQNLILVSTL